jgi:hypothetical protein
MDGETPRSWFRPVSEEEHIGLAASDRQYQDGSEPALLDIVELETLRPRPMSFQSENVVLDDSTYWRRVGRLSWDELADLDTATGPLWTSGYSTAPGLNDKVPDEIAADLTTSLRLIRLDRLQLKVHVPHPNYGNTLKVQARFEFSGVKYWLSVTDPVIEDAYIPQGSGTYELRESLLTVSLSEPAYGASYKLVAGVVQKEHVEANA